MSRIESVKIVLLAEPLLFLLADLAKKGKNVVLLPPNASSFLKKGLQYTASSLLGTPKT